MISYLDYPSYSGLSRRIEGLSKVLESNGIAVQIVCPKYRCLEVGRNERKVARFDLTMLRGRNPDHVFSKLVCLLWFTVLSVRYILQERARFFAIQYESVYSSFAAIAAKILTTAPIIGDDVIVHEETGNHLLDGLTRWLEISVLRFTDVFVTSSLGTLKAVRDSQSKPCVYTPNGVDVSTDAALGEGLAPFGKCIGVFVGAPSYSENRVAIEELLRLPMEMPDYADKFVIWIVGGPIGGLEHRFHDESVRRGVVRLWGSVSDQVLKTIYLSAHVGLLPFFDFDHEAGGQRIKALEFLAHGLIVVSSQAGVRGLAGVVEGRHFISVSSLGEMAEAFKRIIDNPREYSDMTAQAKTYARTLSWNAVSRDYVNFLKTTLAGAIW
jgi:glycosyltransferase involved in cell wall biosynthesis